MFGYWFIVNFYGNIVDNFAKVGNFGHSSVSVGRVYGYTKCALLPYKEKYSTLSVENKAQCSTLWKIEHTFPLWTWLVSYIKWEFICSLYINKPNGSVSLKEMLTIEKGELATSVEEEKKRN